HNGESVAAKKMARRNIAVFLQANVDAVVVNAAGCGAAMKEYGYLLRDDPEYREKAERFGALVKDAGEFLAALGLVGKLQPLAMTVTYQDPCHLAHGQKVRAQPRLLLRSIPGLKLIEMPASDGCCGSAGIYNLTHAEMSQHLLREKMLAVASTGAQAVVAPNPGCMLQLGYGAQRYGPNVEIYHLMDLLDRACGGSDPGAKCNRQRINWRKSWPRSSAPARLLRTASGSLSTPLTASCPLYFVCPPIASSSALRCACALKTRRQ